MSSIESSDVSQQWVEFTKESIDFLENNIIGQIRDAIMELAEIKAKAAQPDLDVCTVDIDCIKKVDQEFRYGRKYAIED